MRLSRSPPSPPASTHNVTTPGSPTSLRHGEHAKSRDDRLLASAVFSGWLLLTAVDVLTAFIHWLNAAFTTLQAVAAVVVAILVVQGARRRDGLSGDARRAAVRSAGGKRNGRHGIAGFWTNRRSHKQCSVPAHIRISRHDG